ncbi:RES family NAD+ phosphorylase [Deinococcus taklimakanensis]|uniref:RES family NAD+ phosphorylase n=1 Tax=Deinococcus taklimakanensis TaxID=536443 RepID=A0ABW5P6M0_9DEIO
MLSGDELLEALSAIDLDFNTLNVHRCVAGRHINSLASTRGSMKADNRYSRAYRFEALYTSYYPTIAMLEVIQSKNFQGFMPGAISVQHFTFSLSVRSDGILDLTVPDVQKLLGTNLQELTGDWKTVNQEYGEDAPTQILGQAAYDCERIKAIRYPSKIDPTMANLVIFKNRIGFDLMPLSLPADFPDQTPL